VRGAFITLEGTEGVGKSTVCARIEDSIRGRGHRLVATREPGGTPLGEKIRSWVLDAEHQTLSAEVETLLMFAARGYHLDNVIRPALGRGDWVLCDRFTDATFAYQGGGRGADRSLLTKLRAEIHRGLEPDLTILLDAPVEIGFARIAGRAKDHFEREDVAFFERVRAVYLDLAAADPVRFRVIDATASLDAVLQQVADALRTFADVFERRDQEFGAGTNE
jgi:dTMP kinase